MGPDPTKCVLEWGEVLQCLERQLCQNIEITRWQTQWFMSLNKRTNSRMPISSKRWNSTHPETHDVNQVLLTAFIHPIKSLNQTVSSNHLIMQLWHVCIFRLSRLVRMETLNRGEEGEVSVLVHFKSRGFQTWDPQWAGEKSREESCKK